MLRFFGLVAIVLLLALNPDSGRADAQDCGLIKEQIKKQRNLLKKKELIVQALESCPRDAEVHYLSAYSAERLRKYDRAMVAYLKATELDPSYAKAFFGLGDIYMVLGNAEAAIRAYENGLHLAPGNQRANSSLELARIKHRSASGGDITAGEFVRVMQESKSRETTSGALDGPIVRMQVHFRIDSAELSQEAIAQLTVVGQALENPALAEHRFEISGHTDNSGDPELNLQLSKARAERVRDYLLGHFNLTAEHLAVAYFGDTRPAAPNNSTQNRALNRRVEFKKLNQ